MAFKADLVAALQALPPAVKQDLQYLKPRLGIGDVQPATAAEWAGHIADYMIRNLKADVEYEKAQAQPKPTVDLS